MTADTGPDDTFFSHLAAAITRRYGLNADKSLWDVYQLSQDFLTLDPDGLDFILAHREEALRSLAEPRICARLVELFLQSTLEFTYASNQFIVMDAGEERILREIYQTYLAALQAALAGNDSPAALKAALEGVIAAHFTRLKANIARFFDPETAADLPANVILRPAVCHEYTPAFQLSVLGLRIEELAAPVLDIGCGKSGALVHYLNQQGVRARGVDRVVETSPYLRKADWLDLRLRPNSWGTILSHMAFSNHFTFHHLYKHGHAEAYARQYIAILAALQPGGAFYYSPGLPFIERLLPAGYQVTRRAVGGAPDGRLYVARVVKMGA